MKTKIANKMLLGLCLAIAVGGCEKQKKPEEDYKTGEAFVVLKSGEVLYMADMEIVCLKQSFKTNFNALKADYERHAPTRKAVTEDPGVKAKLKEMDDGISELSAKIARAPDEGKGIADQLMRGIESERNAIAAEIAKNKDLLNEYKQIVDPLDKRIEELRIEAAKLAQGKRDLISQTIQNINSYIVDSKLTVSILELKNDESLFETTEEFTQHYPSIGSPERRPHPLNSYLVGVRNPFLVEKRRNRMDYGSASDWTSDWIFLKYVPAELEGTPMDATIKAAYKKSLSLQSRIEGANKKLWAETAREHEQLLPWQNRHGISISDGRGMIAQEARQKINLAQLDDQINDFRTDAPKARALVQAEIQKKIAELNESLTSLKKRREVFEREAAKKASDAVEESFESVKNELKSEYRQKFYELLNKNVLTAVRTGSKGDFIVSGEAAYLFAETHRDNSEKLAWLVRVDPKSPKVKMSLSNAASAGGRGDFDDFWMLRWNLAE
ncbi:MAG TPA: hypothetical protein PKA41_00145 [Verrucomicrobiota bacterium]|nr:hypothetical protein [Verrucomicrobiota bacterium]